MSKMHIDGLCKLVNDYQRNVSEIRHLTNRINGWDNWDDNCVAITNARKQILIHKDSIEKIKNNFKHFNIDLDY